MGGFHGMSLGSLALTTERTARDACGVALGNVTHVPHPSMMKNFDTIEYIDMLLTDDHSGVDKPAAIIVEAVQGEGGINILSNEWLIRIRELCDKHDMLLILDDIQTGCCRTGGFFSFERAGIKPDIVVMAKSIGGMGLPCAITLVKPEYDVLLPGEHNGTFRGFQPAFVAGKAAIELMLRDNLEAESVRKGRIIEEFLANRLPAIDSRLTYRGLGVMWGIDCGEMPAGTSQNVRKLCFENGLILELSGREDTVIKIMPPVTVPDATLMQGLEILVKVIAEVVNTTKNASIIAQLGSVKDTC